MNYLARLPVFAAALMLVAPGAHAFTFGNGGTTGGSGNGGATSSYGSTLTSPGGGTLATPEDQAKNFGSGNAGGLDGGTGTSSFRFGAGPFGAGSNQRLAPPAWVGDPLYFDRGH